MKGERGGRSREASGGWVVGGWEGGRMGRMGRRRVVELGVSVGVRGVGVGGKRLMKRRRL